MTVSPDEASEMAWPMVLQAVADDKQLFVSLPVTPFTYHLVLATIVEVGSRTAPRVAKC
jgi:hypothetical protein